MNSKDKDFMLNVRKSLEFQTFLGETTPPKMRCEILYAFLFSKYLMLVNFALASLLDVVQYDVRFTIGLSRRDCAIVPAEAWGGYAERVLSE